MVSATWSGGDAQNQQGLEPASSDCPIAPCDDGRQRGRPSLKILRRKQVSGAGLLQPLSRQLIVPE